MSQAGEIVVRAARPDDVAAMAKISVEARSRYRSIIGFDYVADTPAVSAQRFHDSHQLVAVSSAQQVLGLVLTRPLDGLLLLDNISTASHCRGLGLGKRLLDAVLQEARSDGYPAVALTTFREPPWNSPWFRKQGFESMLDGSIGPALRALVVHQSTYLAARTRETLWRQAHQRR